MTIYLVNSKPCISVQNGFEPIDYLTYQMMIESGEIENMEVVEI